MLNTLAPRRTVDRQERVTPAWVKRVEAGLTILFYLSALLALSLYLLDVVPGHPVHDMLDHVGVAQFIPEGVTSYFHEMLLPFRIVGDAFNDRFPRLYSWLMSFPVMDRARAYLVLVAASFLSMTLSVGISIALGFREDWRADWKDPRCW